MGLKEIIISVALIGLIIIGMLQFQIGITEENEGDVSLLNNTEISDSYEDINESMYDLNTAANSSKEAFVTEKNPFFGTVLFFASIFELGKAFITVIIGVFGATFGIIGGVLGVPPIILAVLSGILLVSLVIFVWRLIKTAQ